MYAANLGVLGGPVAPPQPRPAPVADRAQRARDLEHALTRASMAATLAACAGERASYARAMAAAQHAGQVARSVLSGITGREHDAAQAILMLVARGGQLLESAAHIRNEQSAGNAIVQASCAFARAVQALD